MSLNEITASRQEFALALVGAGLDVLSFVPERIVPPVVIINAGGTYLEPETLGREYNLNLEITAVASQAVNEQSTEILDALIEQTINALPGYARLINVQKPYILQANQAEYLAANLGVQLSITL
jgi:hypothetical protein